MKQRRRIYYNAEQRNLMWDRCRKVIRCMPLLGCLIEDIQRFNGCFRILVEYVHDNEVDQDWCLRCRNAKRYLVALWLAARFDR